MINNDIFNIFCFSTFSFGYFLDLVFRGIFSKFGQNTGFVKYPKEKVEKQKMLKMLLLVICEVPKKISTIFKPFLAIFTLFHLKNWPYLPKPEFGNLAKTRFWLLLVNNSLCSIPRSGDRSEILKNAGDRCVENSVWLCFTTVAWRVHTSFVSGGRRWWLRHAAGAGCEELATAVPSPVWILDNPVDNFWIQTIKYHRSVATVLR